MDQPALTTNASPALPLIHASMQRLARQSATCKLTSAILSGAAMLFASGRVGGEGILWVAAPAVVLGLADAGYTARVRRLGEAAAQYEGARAPKLSELIQTEAGGGFMTEATGMVKGLFSPSVWPYYLSLAGVVVGLGLTVVPPKLPASYPVGPGGMPLASTPGQIQTLGQPGVTFPPGQRQPFGSAPGSFPGVNGSAGATAPGGTSSAGSFPTAVNRVTNRFPGAGGPGVGGPSSPAGSVNAGGPRPAGLPATGANTGKPPFAMPPGAAGGVKPGAAPSSAGGAPPPPPTVVAPKAPGSTASSPAAPASGSGSSGATPPAAPAK